MSVALLSTIFKISKMDIRKKFAGRVRELRTRQGLSQEKLSLECHIAGTYLPSIEKGQRNVSIKIIEKLAKGLGVEICDLFKFSES